VHPVDTGTESDAYIETYELQPIDPQTNGPQLLYGLRYHTHITKPNEIDTFHDQVGYWLWEPATSIVIQTIAIPRAQVALLSGYAEAGDTSFSLHAERGSAIYGICSSRFLDQAFKTVEVHLAITINSDGTWSYKEDTVLEVQGRAEQFHHVDRHTLTKVAEPIPNPMAQPR
jgi:hypothetical protein